MTPEEIVAVLSVVFTAMTAAFCAYVSILHHSIKAMIPKQRTHRIVISRRALAPPTERELRDLDTLLGERYVIRQDKTRQRARVWRVSKCGLWVDKLEAN